MKRAIERFASEAVSQLPIGKIKDPNELMQEFSERFATLIVKKCISLANDPESTAIAEYFELDNH